MFGRNVSYVMVRIGLAAFVGFAISSLLAKALGPELNGLYSLGILLPITAYAIGSMGMAPATVYFLGAKKYSDRVVVSSNLLVSLIASIAIIAFCLAARDLKGTVFPGLSDVALLIGVVAIVPYLLFSNLLSVFQGKQSFKIYGFLSLAPQVSILVGAIILTRLGGDILVNALISWGFGYLVSCLALIFLLRKSISFKNIWGRRDVQKDLIKYGLVSHLSNLVAFLNYRLDVYLLGSLAGASAVGVYAVSVPITEAAWAVSNAVSVVIFPYISSRQNLKPQNPTPRICRIVLAFTLVVAAIIAFFSHYIILSLYGTAYLGAVDVLLILLPGVVLWGGARVLCNDFAGRGRPDINFVVTFLALIVNTVSNFIFIPDYGYIGAAIASCVSYSFFSACIVIVYAKLFSVRFSDLMIIKLHDLIALKSIVENTLRKN